MAYENELMVCWLKRRFLAKCFCQWPVCPSSALLQLANNLSNEEDGFWGTSNTASLPVVLFNSQQQTLQMFTNMMKLSWNLWIFQLTKRHRRRGKTSGWIDILQYGADVVCNWKLAGLASIAAPRVDVVVCRVLQREKSDLRGLATANQVKLSVHRDKKQPTMCCTCQPLPAL